MILVDFVWAKGRFQGEATLIETYEGGSMEVIPEGWNKSIRIAKDDAVNPSTL